MKNTLSLLRSKKKRNEREKLEREKQEIESLKRKRQKEGEFSILNEIKKLKKLDLERLLAKKQKTEPKSDSDYASDEEEEQKQPKKKKKKKQSVLDLINS